MDTFLRDLRYSLRRLRRSPAFTATVVLTLALGIGANTAIFSVVNAVLLRPLGYREPDRLVTIYHHYTGEPELEAPVSAPGFRDYRDKTRSFDAVAVETGWQANLTGTGEPERVPASRVSGDWFRALGVAPQLGRTLLREEDEAGKHHVVVLSDGLWRRAFGADPRVVGRTIQLNGEPYQVVGVMPAGFKGPFYQRADLWRPLALASETYDLRNYTNEFLSLVARVKPGVSMAQAQQEMTAFASRVRADNPDAVPQRWTLTVRSLNELATGKIRPALLVLLGAVGFVLLIACANVANLMLARATSRQREVAIRAALGAERGRLVRQLLTESVVLAVAGGVLGLLLAYWSVKSLVALVPNLPRADEIGLDGAVLAFTLGVAVLKGLLFGIVPSLQSSRADLQHTLREGGRTGSGDRTGHALRRALVVGEVALALTLLVGAGLLIRSVARLSAVNPGFDPDRLLTFDLSLPRTKYGSDTAQIQFFDRAIAAVAAVPGVRAVGATTEMPFGGGWSTGSFSIEGYTPAPNQPGPWGDIRVVSPGFHQAMRMPLRAGRHLSAGDREGSRLVAVIDDEFVKKYFRGQDPIGKRITRGDPTDSSARWITIVGVVGHSSQEGLDAEPRLQLYFPYAQFGTPGLSFAVRAAGNPLALVPSLRAAVRSVDRDLPLANVRTMDDMLESSLGQRRLSMFLLGAYAAIALLLATTGIYGVMSYTVAQRQRELGIRMALGAERGGVLALVLRQGLGLALAGVGIGLAAAYGLTRLLAAQLYSVTATDPLTYGVVAAVLTAVAAVAVLVPATRATRVDPVVVLREE
jgi:putative ABC transport system permease protein